ncbi:hypothetical protein Vretimale_571 [Volvox reticuliferus]|uniref:Uncharacterized protein n=1 Tax=Volvox reticuliferus TaxID=1737510 RepID=A0A8J4FH78_9CHLO|nr:hypothetical protein Vretifemale_2420 [Volvox reticuliferus]GIL94344.1 hypothetical protein Vretimale_571 [Volvox reticuliferus]
MLCDSTHMVGLATGAVFLGAKGCELHIEGELAEGRGHLVGPDDFQAHAREDGGAADFDERRTVNAGDGTGANGDGSSTPQRPSVGADTLAEEAVIVLLGVEALEGFRVNIVRSHRRGGRSHGESVEGRLPALPVLPAFFITPRRPSERGSNTSECKRHMIHAHLIVSCAGKDRYF